MAAKRIVLITGANTGLGFEISKALCKSSRPYELIIGSRSVQKGEAAVADLKKENPGTPTSLSTVQVDIESDESIERALETVSSRFGKIDVLINNAGGNFERDIQEGKSTIRQAWNKAWDVNVAGTYVMTHTFVPLLLKSDDPRLIFVTSGTSALTETQLFEPKPFAAINASPAAGWPKPDIVNPTTSYRSSKAGMNMMVMQWARILKEDGVKIWTISPGMLATNLAGVGAEKLKQIGALDPSVGGEFIKDVVEGHRDSDAGKIIRKDMIQPY